MEILLQTNENIAVSHVAYIFWESASGKGFDC